MKPTRSQVEAEIAALVEIKPRVRHCSAFGDNHHDAIDAQVSVLEGNMDESEIFDSYDPGDSDQGRNVLDEALAARAWLAGEYRDYPRLVDEWKELEIKR